MSLNMRTTCDETCDETYVTSLDVRTTCAMSKT